MGSQNGDIEGFKVRTMEIIIENVRCFQGRYRVPLTPITLLVGENSAGKSTFLAILAALTNTADFPFLANFNTSPYDLGNYENIASRKSTKGRPAQSFRIGFCLTDRKKQREHTAVATYRGYLGQVILSEFTVTAPQGSMSLTVEKRIAKGSFVYAGSKSVEQIEIPFTYQIPDREEEISIAGFFPSLIVKMLTASEQKTQEAVSKIAPELFEILRGGTFPVKHVLSLAPIRTKPRRTYDQFNEEFKPEGDHVPLKLARLLESMEAEEQAFRATVKVSMEQFGQESGLFDSVVIERLGNEPSAPFRVAVHLGGLALNLIDVGYGVSQSLPIIVQSLISKREGMLLMQQPEVHLHPRAQAALGTFFAQLVNTKMLQFVIETHSDFLVDRIRQEVARGRIKPELVTILFFEKKNGHSKIYPISLDREGNVVNPPSSYRQFFLEEELNLLTRGEE
jgi:predicted ATPase